MLFNPLKNLVTFFKKSERGMTKSTNTSSQFCKPLVGLCALLCMSLWISVAQAQQMQMRTALAQVNAVPISYTDSNSEETTATVDPNIDDIAADPFGGRENGSGVGVVDWVEVQIRIVAEGVVEEPTARPTDVANFYIKPAWLLSDGSVVDVDSDIAAINSGTEGELTIPTGTDGLEFDESTQDLYVLVNHRNHLPIMSAAAVVADGAGAYVHDFTVVNQAFSGTAKLVGTSSYVMYAGNATGDANVDDSDVNRVIFGSADTPAGDFGGSGYLFGDYNLSGNVDDSDVNLVIFGSADTPAGNFGTGSPIVY